MRNRWQIMALAVIPQKLNSDKLPMCIRMMSRPFALVRSHGRGSGGTRGVLEASASNSIREAVISSLEATCTLKVTNESLGIIDKMQ